MRIPRAVLIVLACISLANAAQTQLVLNQHWAQTIQNRVTLDIQMNVDHALKTPHPSSKGGDDGDIHFAGRSTDIGLPLVAEIMNAAKEKTALTDLKKVANGTSVPLSGAWRIWFEHPGGDQVQGHPVPVPADTNPAHVFEIHPITKFDGIALGDSLKPIDQYQAYDAKTAFGHYEKLIATILSKADSLTIAAGEMGFNYTQFTIELQAAPVASDDGGLLVMAKIMADSEEAVVDTPIRLVIPAGTDPATAIGAGSGGDHFQVLGIPRVNLNAILALAAHQPSPGKQFQVQLPYEMIIVGIVPQ